MDEYEYQIIFLFSKLTNTNTNIRLKVKRNEFKCMIIYNMNIFNIIIILSISDKESFHFGTECTKYKELKVDFSCITFAFWAKIKQFLGIITANKAVNFSRYLGQLFEYLNNIRSLKILRIRILLFGLNYLNIQINQIFVATLISLRDIFSGTPWIQTYSV